VGEGVREVYVAVRDGIVCGLGGGVLVLCPLLLCLRGVGVKMSQRLAGFTLAAQGGDSRSINQRRMASRFGRQLMLQSYVYIHMPV
jgi:hypothetical protein